MNRTMEKVALLLRVDLTLFDGNTNVTSDSGLSDEMKIYYSDYLIDMAEPKLVHDQFAQKRPLPKNGGKTIEFRKYSPLPKLTSPLNEGVTPDGQKLNVSTLTATVEQYGGFVELSDMLLLTAIDNNLVQATKLLGSQAGRTLDTITREVLCGGTNVQFVGGKSARHLLVGGAESGNDYLNVDTIKRAVRYLKAMNAEKVNGNYYAAIISQDCSYDLTNDPEWKYPHQYKDTTELYSGEIGMVAGCRFVETSEAKIFHAPDLGDSGRNLTVKTYDASSRSIQVEETVSSSMVGRKVIIKGQLCEISAAFESTKVLELKAAPAVAPVAGDIVYPGEAGAEGRDVYATIIIGENAYGTTSVDGGGLQHIVKQLGSAGTSDPLNQRATAGWKATKVAKRLVEEYMIRIESTSTFNDLGAN